NVGHQHGEIALESTLILSELRKPGVVPVPRVLALPLDPPAHETRQTTDRVDHVPALLALLHPFERVPWEGAAQCVVEINFEHITLELRRSQVGLALGFVELLLELRQLPLLLL